MNCCASREKNDACISSSETQPAIERKFKDSGVEWIGEIPEKWSKDKVFRVFANIGSGTTPKATEDSNFEGEINWIQSGDINGSIMNSCKNKISQQVLNKYSALKIYKAPFIIVAMYGASVGNISVSMIDGCVNQACCVMSDSVHYFDYLFYAIKSAKDYLIYRAEGGGQPNISQDKLKNLWLPIPPLSEQQAIASYLDAKTSQIDSLISLKQQKIDELKSYKKSIIYEYVTGKKRV
jgi:type I restriction enzyme S subunit